MVDELGHVRPHYSDFKARFESLPPTEIVRRKHSADRSLMSSGITFNVYKGDSREEHIFPFDIIPRIIPPSDWGVIEKGLQQRIHAINLFLDDIYNDQKILKDKIIPRELIESSPGFLKQCMGLHPPKDVWIHITGTDLIRHSDGKYYVLEDNLRCPSGVSYVLTNREIMKRTFPEVFEKLSVRLVSDYPLRLRSMLREMSDEDWPNIAVLTPGIFNSAYFEHSFLAQQMGVELVEGRDLIVLDGRVKMKTTRGLRNVDVIYRRIDDNFLDPKAFREDSMLGVPGLFEVYKKGKVVLANAPGTGVADDKIIYAYVPQMIRYYLGEDSILENVKTYVCEDKKDLQYVLDNMAQLVVKEANNAGGYGMLIGSTASQAEIEDFKNRVQSNPRNYLAQPIISLSRVPTLTGENVEGRHVDLRPFILYGKDIYVMPGGLTRVALKKGSLVVNSSQGGGSKDTWVPGD
ncbi:MAG: circularly permuted type 2 ATP-grasp protein [Leptospiraceae bacterium]|nr:circularly permuted type 2 ATP-grasp protein [Leptospiraceae bacterium]